MGQTPTSMSELLDRIVVWMKTNSDIRGALLIGSRARVDRPADEWSDLDLVIIAAEPDRYLDSADWLETIGTPWVTFVEGTIARTRERRVLFEGALDVDFNFFTRERFQQVFRDGSVPPSVLHRGARVLVDKDGIIPPLSPPSAAAPAVEPPSEAEFLAIVNEFWYRAVWATKKLRRGELYIAVRQCNGDLKGLVRAMLERHSRATHRWEYDTWHDGRFLEKWADPRALAALRDAYACYDAEDCRRALLATMDLFRWVAMETAERLGFSYPAIGDERATAWVKNCLAEGPR
jgi:aminoglycoside 6-adenylyltransferase